MFYKLVLSIAAILVTVSSGRATERDGIISDDTRRHAKRNSSPGSLNYGWIKVDSKGQVVSLIYTSGPLAKTAKVAMGVFDKEKKEWVAGEAIEGGIGAELFTKAGKVLRVRVTVEDDDNKRLRDRQISRILVTDTDYKVVTATGDFDAIFKGLGRGNVGGRVAFSFVRVELNEKGEVINAFGLSTTAVNQETKVFMGKYNEKEEKWEAGDAVPNGLYGELFKDPGAKNIYIRITMRADRSGVEQVLVRRVGDKGKK